MNTIEENNIKLRANEVWTTTEVNLLRILFKKGLSDDEISNQLMRTTKSIVLKRNELNLKKQKNIAWTKNEEQTLVELIKRKNSYVEMSKKIGRSINAIEYKIKDLKSKGVIDE